MKRNMKAWAADVIKAKEKAPLPILSFPSVSLLGVSVTELTADADLQARGMKLVADRVPALAAVSMMDLSVEAEAFGANVRFLPNEVPTVTGILVETPEDADALKVPQVGDGRTGKYVEAIGKACELITDRPVFAGVIGPFSLAGRLMGVSDIMVQCYEEPEAVHVVLRKATDFLSRYIRAYRDIGAHGVVIAEPLAGLLSPALAGEFSSAYVKDLVKAVQSDEFLVIYHNCGNNTPLMMDSILETGCDGYHFGDAVDMALMVGKVPADRLVMGNVSPSAQFLSGTPTSIREDTLRVLAACAPGHPNFVLSSGCDIPPKSPWDNIDAFFAAARAYYGETL